MEQNSENPAQNHEENGSHEITEENNTTTEDDTDSVSDHASDRKSVV